MATVLLQRSAEVSGEPRTTRGQNTELRATSQNVDVRLAENNRRKSLG